MKVAGTVHARLAEGGTWRVWNVSTDLIGLKQCAALRKDGGVEARYYPFRHILEVGE